MAEFLTMSEAEDKFGSKGKANAGLTLGIIGTGLAALAAGNNGGCGGGFLSGILGGNGGNCLAEKAMQTAMAQGQMADNLAWSNRVQSMEDDMNLYSYVNNTTRQLSDENYEGRIVDQREKCSMYVDLLSRDNAQNLEVAAALANAREKDVKEKADIFERLSSRINDIEKREVATATAIPLMFELTQVKANKYTDDLTSKTQKEMLILDGQLQRQLDHKINGELKYAYNNLCAPVPNISPLYCSPFTTFGSGTTWSGCCNSGNCSAQ